MVHSKIFRFIIAAFIVCFCAGVSILVSSSVRTPETKIFNIKARQYAYDPPVIKVNRGDTVHIRLTSQDVVHGFYLEGHNINAEIYPMKPLIQLSDPSQRNGFRDVEEIVFIAEKIGKFRYRCSHTCGYLHPFMQGELVVDPNYPFQAAVGAALGIFFAGCFLFFLSIRRPVEHTAGQFGLEETQTQTGDHQ